MKTRLIIYMVLFATLGFIACKEEPNVGGLEEPEVIVSPEDAAWQYEYDPRPTKSQHFVRMYIEPGAFEVVRNTSGECPPKMDCDLYISEESWTELEWSAIAQVAFFISPLKAQSCGYYFDGKKETFTNEEKFKKISRQNKDVAYNDYYWSSGAYYNEPAKAINMSCTTDYDSEHPANASLNDIVEIKYFTAKPFLDSRYKNKRLGDTYYSRTREPLPLFISKKVPLVSANFYLRLTKNPEKAGVYSFTITYVDSQGKEYSATSKPTRLEARKN